MFTRPMYSQFCLSKMLLFLSEYQGKFVFCYFLSTWFFIFIQEKIESATDVLKAILKPVFDEVEETPWPPRDPAAISLMERVCFRF